MKKVIVLLFLLMLVACGTSDGAVTPAPEVEDVAAEGDETAATPDTTDDEDTAVAEPDDQIIVQMAVYDWEAGSYRDLIETFEAENPDIQIKTVSVEEILGLGSGGGGRWPEDAAQRMASSADVFTGNIGGRAARQNGLLLDLEPLMQADADFDRDDFYPNTLENFESDGGIWGVPTQVNFTLLFYQKEVFDAAGIEYPQPGWSWDDLLAAAQATTVREGDETTQWGLVQAGVNPFEFVRPRTGPLIDTSTDPPTPLLDRPEVVDALQWFADLYLVHEVAPNLEIPELDEDGAYIPPGYELIESGQAAIWPEWSGSWQWRSSQMDLGVVPFPVDEANDQTTALFVNGFSISAGTRNPQAAWRWLDFLSRQPSANDFDDTAVPARRSVAEASGFWDGLEPELSAALSYAVDHSYYFSYSAGYTAFSEAWEAILNEGQSVEEALAEAQIAAEVEIAEAEEEEGDSKTEEVVVAAPQIEEVPEGATVIVFSAGGGPGGLQPYRDLAESFQEQHPDIVVELQTPDFGTGPISVADIAVSADCVQWFGSTSNEEDRAAVLSLEPFFDADPDLNKDDFYPHAIDSFSYQGQLWGLPAEVNVPVIRYNRALFDAAGVDYPEVGWTTDDFLETAVALTAGDDPVTKQYGYVSQEFEINDLTSFLDRLGAQVLDESEEPARLNFTHPDTVAAMRWMTNLTTEFGVKPTLITNIGSGGIAAGEERKTLIENGRAAMWSDQGFQSFPEINLEDLDIGVVPLPVGPDGSVTIGNAFTGYFISSASQNRQACWEWLKFLSNQPSLDTLGNSIPARLSMAESDAYTEAVGSELAAANRASMSGVSGPSDTQRLGNEFSWLGTGHFWWQSYAYDQILNGDATVEDALAEVQEKADAYRDCIIERDGFDEQNIQRQCLGEVDDTVPSFWIEVEEE